MNGPGSDPAPESRADATDSRFGCPVCKTHFAAKDGYIFFDSLARRKRARRAGTKGRLPCFDKLTCILCFVNDEESGHC